MRFIYIEEVEYGRMCMDMILITAELFTKADTHRQFG